MKKGRVVLGAALAFVAIGCVVWNLHREAARHTAVPVHLLFNKYTNCPKPMMGLVGDGSGVTHCFAVGPVHMTSKPLPSNLTGATLITCDSPGVDCTGLTYEDSNRTPYKIEDNIFGVEALGRVLFTVRANGYVRCRHATQDELQESGESGRGLYIALCAHRRRYGR